MIPSIPPPSPPRWVSASADLSTCLLDFTFLPAMPHPPKILKSINIMCMCTFVDMAMWQYLQRSNNKIDKIAT